MNASTIDKTKSLTTAEPILSPIDADHIVKFAESKKILLTKKQIALIDRALLKNENIKQLAELIQQFCDIYESIRQMPGLTNEQVAELKTLAAKMRAYHLEKEKPHLSIQAYKEIISIQKRMIELEKLREWWETNRQALNKQNIWDGIIQLTVQECKDNGELDQETARKLDQLEEIKISWQMFSLFAGFSSENLLIFYRDFICQLENYLHEMLPEGKKTTDVTLHYVTSLLQTLEKIKACAVNAMAYRLYCTDYFQHIACDDILSYTCHRIRDISGIYILDADKIPDLRLGLTPDTLITFTTIIRDYKAKNPKTPLLTISHLTSQTPPVEWEEYAKTKPAVLPLIKNPILIYFAKVFPHFIEHKLSNDELLPTLIAYVNRYKTLLTSALSQYDIEAKKIHVNDTNPIKKLLDFEQRKFNDFLLRTNELIEASLAKEMAALIEATFANKALQDDHIDSLLKKINTINEFQKTFLNKYYLPVGDVILALANKLLQLLAANESLPAIYVDNIKALLTFFYVSLSSEQSEKLNNIINELPSLFKNIKNHPPEKILHTLIHHLESPFLNTTELPRSLARHKEVATTFGETWNATETDSNAYVTKVLAPLIATAPQLNLDNFNQYRVNCLSTTPPGDLIENLMLKRFGDLFNLKAYLHDQKTFFIDKVKLKSLITRVNAFFTIPSLKQAMLALITTACADLTLAYCIKMIGNDVPPDIEEIKAINDLLKTNLFATICQDESLRKVIKTYIELYTGSTHTLSHLMVALAPEDLHCECQPFIIAYATKRLAFIESTRTVTKDDHLFFSHFMKVPDISIPFEKTRQLFLETIRHLLVNPDASLKEENIVKTFGTLNDSQQLHTTILLNHLNHSLDFSTLWLGRTLIKNAAHFSMLTDLDKNAELELSHLFYEELFGKENIKRILVKLDVLIAELIQANQDKHGISNHDYLRSIIASIKPLTHFYKIYSHDKEKIAFVDKLAEIDKKIILHKELQTAISNNPLLSQVNTDNLPLHNAMLTLMKVSKKIVLDDLLTQESAHHYLTFVEENVLKKLTAILRKDANTLDFKTFAMIYNLLLQLINEKFKLALIYTHKNDIKSNPHILALINHLGRNDATLSPSMQPLLDFSQQLSKLKTHVKHWMQTTLLKEIKFNVSQNSSLPITLAPYLPALKDSQLLTLWMNITKKMAGPPLLGNDDHDNYLHFMSKLAKLTADELLQRAKSNPALLTDFIQELGIINAIASSHHLTFTTNHYSLWTSTGDMAGYVQPLFEVIDKAKAQKLFFVVESFTKKMTPKQQQEKFTPDLIELHKHLTTVINGQKSLVCIEQLIKRLKTHPTSPEFSELLLKLTTFIQAELPHKNDASFKSSIKKVFAIS